MSKTNKIAVILASHNGSKYIVEQINSILNQENVEVEILIFDDNSKDSTIKKISIFKDEERVFLIEKIEGSGGAAKNFFYGLLNLEKHLSSDIDFIAFSDQDDIWLPNKLSRSVSKLDETKSNLYMSNLTTWIQKTNKKSLLKKSYPQKKYDFLFEGGSAGCTYVFKKEMYDELKKTLVNIELTSWTFLSHDWFVYFFARINKWNVYIDKQSNILYRIHDNNVHGHMNTLSIKGLAERVKLIKKGWYFNHIAGFLQLVKDDSEEKHIYKMYSKNVFTRVFILLKYNFQLMRSSKKFIVFFLLSCLPVAKKNKHLKNDL